MKKLITIIAALATIATAADYQSAVVKQIETTTTNTVPWDGNSWTTDGLFTLSAHPGKYAIRADNWNVPGMAAPSEAQIVAWAEADAGAYRLSKKMDVPLAALRTDEDFRQLETWMFVDLNRMGLIPGTWTNFPPSVTEKQMRMAVVKAENEAVGTGNEESYARIAGRLNRLTKRLKDLGHPDLSKAIKHAE